MSNTYSFNWQFCPPVDVVVGEALQQEGVGALGVPDPLSALLQGPHEHVGPRRHELPHAAVRADLGPLGGRGIVVIS